jgi:predicted membrane protein
MKTGFKAQRGISLIGVIVTGIILIFMVIIAAKVGPAYIQSKSIQKEFEAILSSPETKDVSDHDIRAAFIKWASVSDVNAIKESDIDITREGGRITISASYEMKIPLVANATLLLDFSPSASR